MATSSAVFVDDSGETRLSGSITLTPSPGSVVRGPFAFAYNTPSINNGVAIYTPTVNDILLDAWIEVDVAFDGTTPLADLSQYTGSDAPIGLWAEHSASAQDLSFADSINNGGGPLGAGGRTPLSATNADVISTVYRRVVPARFTTADPLLLVVSQNGHKGGTAIGGAAGTGRVYIVTATPVAL